MVQNWAVLPNLLLLTALLYLGHLVKKPSSDSSDFLSHLSGWKSLCLADAGMYGFSSTKNLVSNRRSFEYLCENFVNKPRSIIV